MLTISTIVKARYFARAAFRVIAVGLILEGLFGLYLIAYYLQDIRDGVVDPWTRLATIGVRVGLPLGAGFILLNVGERAARWVFPLPERRCPFCAYALEPGQNLCPECGISMDAPIPTTKPPSTTPTDA